MYNPGEATTSMSPTQLLHVCAWEAYECSARPTALTKCPKRSPNLNSHTGACSASKSI